MAQHTRSGWRARLATAMALAVTLLSVMTGCSLSQTASSSPRNSRGAPGPISAVATPTATWSVQCAGQALPQGWAWYRDARYPFRVAAPLTWRTGSFEYVPDGSNLGAASPSYIHVVDFFGPGSNGQSQSSGKMRSDTASSPEIIIEVGVGQQARIDGVTQNPAFRAQPAPVCIGSTPVTLYVFTNSEGDVERVALLPAGPRGYPYAFTVASNAETAARDGQIFLTVLGSFAAVADG